jgi:hypothetical protein
MLQWQVGTAAHLGERGYRYERHRPVQTPLYQPVRAVLSRFRGPASRTGHGIAWVCPAGIRRLPEVRPSGTWFPASAL